MASYPSPGPRNLLDFDELKKSVRKAWGAQPQEQERADRYRGSQVGEEGESDPKPLRMTLPIPLNSATPGGPPKLLDIKIAYIPFEKEVAPDHEAALPYNRTSRFPAKAPSGSPRSPRNAGFKEQCRVPTRKPTIDAFRITAQVVRPAGAPPAQRAEKDALPEPMAFPVVLALCDSQRQVELVSEGLEALGLKAGPPTVPQDGANPHPMLGVADLIVAGCATVMDL